MRPHRRGATILAPFTPVPGGLAIPKWAGLGSARRIKRMDAPRIIASAPLRPPRRSACQRHRRSRSRARRRSPSGPGSRRQRHARCRSRSRSRTASRSAAARVEGSDRFEIIEDGCAGDAAGEHGARCRTSASRRPRPGSYAGDRCTSAMPSSGSNAAAYGVGPSLEASRTDCPGRRAGDAAEPRSTPVRSIRLVNRGDEPIRVTRLALARRNAAVFSLVSADVHRPPARAGRALRDPRPAAIARRRAPRRAGVATDLPQAPYAVALRTDDTTPSRPERPMCPCATAPQPSGRHGASASSRARFASGVVTDVYSSRVGAAHASPSSAAAIAFSSTTRSHAA